MALTGNLRTLSLAEIFQTLGRSQATGILRLSSVDGMTEVLFDQGDVLQVRVNNAQEEFRLSEIIEVFGGTKGQPMDAFGSGGIESIMRQVDSGSQNMALLQTHY